MIACLLALAVTVAALWQPLAHLSTSSMGNWRGLGEQHPLLKIDEGPVQRDASGGDPLRQFVPWALFARAEFWAGRMPLWDPHCGTGVPLLANLQSAVLSPFTLPYFVLPVGAAMLFSSALRIIVATVGAFLFLRSLARTRSASALGAVSYGLSGFHLLYPLHPHTGVLALLPTALLATQHCARRFESAPCRLPLRALSLLSLVLGLMVLAGHPESLLFTVYLVALFAAFVLLRTGWALRASHSLRRLPLLGCGLLTAGLLGASLGAVQLLPFFEYLQHSASLAAAGRELGAWTTTDVLLQFIPDAHGQVVGAHWAERGLMPAFHESAAFVVGGSTAILALGALVFPRRDVNAWFFAVVGACLLLYLFDTPVLAELASPLFGRGYVFASRASPIWCACASVLAAYTLDQIQDRSANRGCWRALVVVLVGLAIVAVCRLAIAKQLGALQAQDPVRFAELQPANALGLDFIVAAVVLAILSVAALAFSTRSAARAVSTAVLLIATLAQGALAFGRFVPIAPDKYVLPQTSALAALRSAVGNERVVLLSTGSVQPNVNVLHGVALVTSYDALEIRELDQLRGHLFGYTGYGAFTLRASRHALDLFGVRYVASPGEWLPIDTERSHRFAKDANARWYLEPELGLPREPRSVELLPEHASTREEFTCSRDGFDGVVLHFLQDGSAGTAQLSLEVRDVESGVVLSKRDVRLSELRRLGGDRLECMVEVPRQSASKNRRFALEVEAIALAEGERVRVFRDRLGTKEGLETRDERRERGRIVLDMSYQRSNFERVGEIGSMVLYRYVASRGRAWLVPDAEAAVDADAALSRVLAKNFDPRSAVVLEHAATQSAQATQLELEELEPGSTRARFAAICSTSAFLVLAQPHYPGWVARVNGSAVELLRANAAFCAVALSAGTSEIEIAYEPLSFRAGALISLATLALLVIASIRGRARHLCCSRG